MDDNRSGDLNYEEFKKGMHDVGLQLNDEEMAAMFLEFDRDNSGSVKYDEFLKAVRVSHIRSFHLELVFIFFDTYYSLR